MFRIYFAIHDRIDRLNLEQQRLAAKRSYDRKQGSAIGFALLYVVFKVFCFSLAAMFTRLLIIVFTDAAHGFAFLFNHGKTGPNGNSFSDYRRLQKRLRVFSFGGLIVLVIASSVVGLFLNLFFGGRLFSQAATFGWVQGGWDANSTPAYVAMHSQAEWGNSSTTAYYAKDAFLVISQPAPSDSFLTLATTSSGLTQTDDGTALSGFNLAGFAASSTQVRGAGEAAHIALGVATTTEFTLGQRFVSTPNLTNANNAAWDNVNNKIYVADTANRRVVRFDSGFGAAAYGANFEVIYSDPLNSADTFLNPYGVSLDVSLNRVFVSDTNRNRIVSFDSGGGGTTFGANWHSLSMPYFFGKNDPYTGEPTINYPQPLAIAADTVNQRIYAILQNGSCLSFMSYDAIAVNYLGTIADCVSSGNDNDPRYFSGATSIAIDNLNSKVYVSEVRSSIGGRIDSFDANSTGSMPNWATTTGIGISNLQASLAVDGVHNAVYLSNNTDNVQGWLRKYDSGTGGTTLGDNMVSVTSNIKNPAGIAIDVGNNSLVVVNTMSNMLLRLNSFSHAGGFGNNQRQVAGQGSSQNQYSSASGISVDDINHRVYVADSGNSRIVALDSGGGTTTWMNNWASFGTAGASAGQFSVPRGVYADEVNNKLYVADTGNNRIVKFDSGTGGTTFGANWETVSLNLPKDVFVDVANNRLYALVASTTYGYLAVMNAGQAGGGDFGASSTTFGSFGSSTDQFVLPSSIFVDSEYNKVYIADTGNNRLVKFDSGSGGTTLGANWQDYGAGNDPQINAPRGVFVDNRNNANKIYFNSSANNLIVAIDSGDNGTVFGDGLLHYGSTGTSYNQFSAPYGLAGDISSNQLLVVDSGNFRLVRADLSALVDTFFTSGVFTSGVIDTGQVNTAWGLADWSTKLYGQTVSIKARSAATADMAGAFDWAGCSNLPKGGSLNIGGCVVPNQRFMQYQVTLSTTDVFVTPILNDFNFNFDHYPSDQSLTSAIYDSSSDANVMGTMSWYEALGPEFQARISLRTASTADLIASSSWADISIDDCSKDAGTGQVTCNYAVMPPELRDGIDDRFFQYKLTLLTPGNIAPHIESVRAEYIVNSAPEAMVLNQAAEDANGIVALNFSVRDQDTSTGKTPNTVVIGLQYWDGMAWQTASSTYLSGDVGVQAVEEATTTNYQLSWDARHDFPEQFFASTSDFRVRVTAYDGEQANHTGYGESNVFRLDTKMPQIDSTIINAFQIPTEVQLDVVDDSQYFMKIGFDPTLADAPVWVPFQATNTVTLANDESILYVQFKDEYENATPITVVERPMTPKNVIIRDITNADADIIQLFLAWRKDASTTNFSKYVVFRSLDDGATFDRYAEIPDRFQNYFFDNGLLTTQRYTYRIVAENTQGSLSRYVTTLSDTPDGQDMTVEAPVISGVSVATTTSQTATIVWETDKPSNSTVGFSATPGNWDTETGVATFMDYDPTMALPDGLGHHEVTVTGLLPNTTYYFRVKSTDMFGNFVQAASGTDGYTFTTKPGPVISNATTTETTHNTATIYWETDVPANSMVSYSKTNDMVTTIDVSNPSEATTTHWVTLTNLDPLTTYYYFVRSRDESGYEAIGKFEVSPGVLDNFSFTTLNDNKPPLIVDGVICVQVGDSALSLRWQTDKPASAAAVYGLNSGIYSSSSVSAASSTYNSDHVVDLENLTASTTYYFQVINGDALGNISTSSEYSCITGEQTTTEKDAQEREQEAYERGVNDGSRPASSGGGGVIIIDKNDKIAPTISAVSLSDLTDVSVKLLWTTNEMSSGFVEYGTSTTYGSYWGQSTMSLERHATLQHLSADTTYNYRVSAADASGNLSYSPNYTFKTKTAEQQLKDLGESASSSLSKPGLATTSKFRAFVEKLIENMDISGFDESLIAQYNTIQKLAMQAMSGPVLLGEPQVEVTANTATISWQTDRDANTQVALANAETYFVNKGKKDPYVRIEGDPYTFNRSHKMVISDLKPGTTYHFQVRSRAQLGPIVMSPDYKFRTSDEQLEITSHTTEILGSDKVNFKWLTSYETNSFVKYIPYRGNALSIEESKTVMEKTQTRVHEMILSDLEGGVVYQVELSGVDQKGRRVTKTIPTFTTSKDEVPPQITQIQTDSALSQAQSKNQKVQTIIYWYTSEPTISQVMYEKGAVDKAEMSESTPLETGYSKKHVVVLTKFDPGQVYSFRVVATDSAGNTSTSSAHTILTPKQKEGVFELIIRNFEQTFGWLGQVVNR